MYFWCIYFCFGLLSARELTLTAQDGGGDEENFFIFVGSDKA